MRRRDCPHAIAATPLYNAGRRPRRARHRVGAEEGLRLINKVRSIMRCYGQQQGLLDARLPGAFIKLRPYLQVRDEFGQVRLRAAPRRAGKQENKVPRLVRPRAVAGRADDASFSE